MAAKPLEIPIPIAEFVPVYTEPRLGQSYCADTWQAVPKESSVADMYGITTFASPRSRKGAGMSWGSAVYHVMDALKGSRQMRDDLRKALAVFDRWRLIISQAGRNPTRRQTQRMGLPGTTHIVVASKKLGLPIGFLETEQSDPGTAYISSAEWDPLWDRWEQL